MKIGIFGDSFADNIKLNPTASWPDLLAEKYEVENYALRGSNLYYSIRQFEEHHHKFDKIIFLVTNPARIALPTSTVEQFKLDQSHFKFINGLRGVDLVLKFLKNTKEKLILDIYSSLKTYMVYVQDLAYERYIHALLLDKLQLTRPDIILIPCFRESLIKLPSLSTLYSVYSKENISWDYTESAPNLTDLRNCHMTAENNAKLAKIIIDCLEKGEHLNLTLNDFSTPTLESKNFYIKNNE